MQNNPYLKHVYVISESIHGHLQDDFIGQKFFRLEDHISL